jgi:hypothetical protein
LGGRPQAVTDACQGPRGVWASGHRTLSTPRQRLLPADGSLRRGFLNGCRSDTAWGVQGRAWDVQYLAEPGEMGEDRDRSGHALPSPRAESSHRECPQRRPAAFHNLHDRAVRSPPALRARMFDRLALAQDRQRKPHGAFQRTAVTPPRASPASLSTEALLEQV